MSDSARRVPAPGTTRAALLAALATAALVLAGLAVPAAPAGAAGPHPRVVTERPVAWTPHLTDGSVHAIAAVGDTVLVGGTFTQATDATGEARHPRRYLMGFHRFDGRLSRFQAQLDGPVYALAPGPAGTVFIGGAFRTVNGVPQRGLAQLRVSDGSRVASFGARINWGTVHALASHGGWLYLGGRFSAVNGTARTGLARVHAGSGALDSGLDAQLTLAGPGGPTVRDLALTPGGDRLVAVGAFSHSAGLLRPQVLILETAGARARLANWYTDAYEPGCRTQFRGYVRGVDFAPDGSYFVAVTTGGTTHPRLLCNTAARFDTGGTGMHDPVWVNHTGGNSLYGVAATGAAVYVGGHQRWQDNPYGNKSAGPGAVPREGIAALHPVTGRALSWNPGRSRGVGAQAFLATPQGLFVGSDTARIGGVQRGRIAMLPLG